MMDAILTEQNFLMDKIVTEYGDMIRGAVYKASGGTAFADDIVSEVYFAILLTLRKLGEGWTPPKSFIFTVIKNKVNDFLRQKYREKDGLEEIKRRQSEQACQREEVMPRISSLTRCEFQVFRLLGMGLTNQEIAKSLHVSLHTVRSHMKKVNAKCGVGDRAKLSLIAHHVCYREHSESDREAPADSLPQAHGAYLRRDSRARRISGSAGRLGVDAISSN